MINNMDNDYNDSSVLLLAEDEKKRNVYSRKTKKKIYFPIMEYGEEFDIIDDIREIFLHLVYLGLEYIQGRLQNQIYHLLNSWGCIDLYISLFQRLPYDSVCLTVQTVEKQSKMDRFICDLVVLLLLVHYGIDAPCSLRPMFGFIGRVLKSQSPLFSLNSQTYFSQQFNKGLLMVKNGKMLQFEYECRDNRSKLLI
jgi:hypothetical protein